MAKHCFYFTHDYNARHDSKLESLFLDHGLRGIGAYWCIVEMIYEENGQMRMNCERIAKVLRDDPSFICVVLTKYDLFENDGEFVWSNSIKRRIEERMSRSEKARESANKRWEGRS